MNSKALTIVPGADLDELKGLADLLLAPLLAITQAMTTSFKKELMLGLHNFTITVGNNFKIALYTSGATMDATTANYSTTNEVVGTGYTAGGKALTNVTPTTSGTTAFTDFDDVVWTAASITARGALIYNADQANRSVAVLDFGSDFTSTAGNFTITFPTANASAAILRLA